MDFAVNFAVDFAVNFAVDFAVDFVLLLNRIMYTYCTTCRSRLTSSTVFFLSLKGVTDNTVRFCKKLKEKGILNMRACAWMSI